MRPKIKPKRQMLMPTVNRQRPVVPPKNWTEERSGMTKSASPAKARDTPKQKLKKAKMQLFDNMRPFRLMSFLLIFVGDEVPYRLD